MRSRRFSRSSRIPREPIRWARVDMPGDLHVLPSATLTDLLVLWDPTGFTSGLADTEMTVRRIKLSDPPVFKWADTFVGFAGGVCQLKWYVLVMDQDNVGTFAKPGAGTFFTGGYDVLAMGCQQAVFGGSTPNIQPVWNFLAPGPWIDVQVSRKIQANEFVGLALEATYPCDLAVLEDPAESFWCVRTDISVLYQRTMRKR